MPFRQALAFPGSDDNDDECAHAHDDVHVSPLMKMHLDCSEFHLFWAILVFDYMAASRFWVGLCVVFWFHLQQHSWH